jgi:hypothetical protein
MTQPGELLSLCASLCLRVSVVKSIDPVGKGYSHHRDTETQRSTEEDSNYQFYSSFCFASSIKELFCS